MSTILGVFSRGSRPINKKWGQQMLQASNLWPYDRQNSYASSSVFLACQHQFNTPQAILAEQPYSDKQGLIHLVFDGRLDNRQELAKTLNLELSQKTTDEELILQAFNLFGKDVAGYLMGDFALAIYNSTNDCLFLIRDHMGVRPLFTAITEEYIAFASNKKALLVLSLINQDIDEQWLADLLAVTKVDYCSTFYKDIQSFLPAHWMTVDGRQLTVKKYWELNASIELSGLSDTEYTEKFKALLFEAVGCRLRSFESNNASELSGGLDSTSVSAIAASILQSENNRINTFSHQLPSEYQGKVFPFKDESEWIELFTKKIKGTKHTPIYSRNRGVIAALRRSNKVHAGPNRNDLTTMTAELFETLQKKNTRTLLSGFGGDQLVTSHATGWVEELAENRQWATLWKEGIYMTSSYHKTVRFMISTLLKKYKLHPISPYKKFLNSWGDYSFRLASNISFLEYKDYPKRYYKHPTRPFFGTIREREQQVIHSPHVLYRLEDSAVGAASYGVDYRYPLLDVRLLEFCLSLPLHQKIRDGFSRRMIRVATKDILPDKIRLRQDKSRATVPTVRQQLLYNKQVTLGLITQRKKNTHIIKKYLDLNTLENEYTNLVQTNSPRAPIKSILRILSLMLLENTH